MKNLPLFVLLVSLIFILPSCNKEDNSYEEIPDYSSKNSSVTIERVKTHFSKYKAAPSSSFDGDQLILPRNAKPIWSLAKETIFYGNTEIVIVPILPITENTRWNAYQNGRIVFYEKPNGEIGENLLLFHSDPKLFAPNVKPTNSNFSGLIYQIDENGILTHPSIAKRGKIVKHVSPDFLIQFVEPNSSNLRGDPNPLGCKVPWYHGLGAKLYNLFERFGNYIEGTLEGWLNWFLDLFSGDQGGGSGPGNYPNDGIPGANILGGNWSYNPNGIYPKPPALDWPNVDMDLDILFKTGIFSDWSIALPYIVGLEVIKFKHDIHITTRQLYIELAECYGINWEATLEENPTFENFPPFTSDLEWNQGNSGSSTSSSGIVPFEIIITFAHTPYAELGDCEKAIVDKYDPDKNGVKSYEWATPWLLNECEEVYTEIVNILPSLKAHCNTYSINLFVGEALEDEDCSVENFYCKLSKPDTPTYIPCTWKAVESDVCQNAAANFIDKYNLSISVAELNALVGEGRFCGCEENFELKAKNSYLILWLNLTNIEGEWLLNNPETQSYIYDYVLSLEHGEDTNEIAKAYINVKRNGAFYGPYPNDYQYDLYISYYNFVDPIIYPEYIAWYTVLKMQWNKENPNQNCDNLCEFQLFTQAYWLATKEAFHLSLDICGILVPVICDLTNGIIYQIEGDGANASLSYLGIVPIIGEIAVGTKLVNFYKVGNKTFELTLKVGQNVYEFGYYGKLAKLLKPAANEQCHHIITWAMKESKLVQLAARKGWHPSHVRNGINLNKAIHSGYDAAHRAYSTNLEACLVKFGKEISDPDIAKNFLENLQNSIRNQLDSGLKLNEIIFP